MNDKLDKSSITKFPEEETLPPGWKLAKLGEIARVGSGNSAPQDKKLYENGIYPLCRTSDVGKVHISNDLISFRNYLNTEGIKNLKLFTKGTILFPKSGASTRLNHRVMLGVDSHVTSHLATIVAFSDKVFQKFLFYVLCEIDANELIGNSGYPSLKLSTIEEINIPLPPLKEQRAIVETLETWDKAIDKTKKLINAKEKEFKWASQIIQKNYKDNSTYSKNELLPTDWKLIKLGDCISTISPPCKIKAADFLKNGRYPIIDQSQCEIAGYTNDEKAIITMNLPLVIFGDHTCLIKYIDRPFAQGADGVKIISPNNDLLTKYLYFYLKFNPVGPNGYTRHFKYLKDIQIPLPPLEEQKSIVGVLEIWNINIQRLKLIVKKYKTQKQGIMQKLLIGELRD